MNNTHSPEPFAYWKHPWGKWMVLAAAAAQLICLWLTISDYQEISKARDLIFSAAGYEKWKTEKLFQCSLYGIGAAVFSGGFLIGMFSRSKRRAAMAEGFLLLVISVSWLLLGFIFDFASLGSWKYFWLLVAGCAAAAGLSCIWKSRHSEDL